MGSLCDNYSTKGNLSYCIKMAINEIVRTYERAKEERNDRYIDDWRHDVDEPIR